MESEFLFVEPKNELHKHANTHGSKKIGFILEKRTKLSAQTLRGGKLSSKRQDLQQFISLPVLIGAFWLALVFKTYHF